MKDLTEITGVKEIAQILREEIQTLADDVSDLHLNVVHHVHQVEHRVAVAADNDEIGIEHLGLV